MSGNSYIVVFNDEVTADQIDKYVAEVKEGGGEVTKRFDAILNGFSARISDQTLNVFKSLQGDVIKYIEPDQVVTTQ
ncbi:protease propeptide/inhibitor [Fomitiporia mediterranea MF3/22]|uniref:protease propeptide/inhibitor n=1 Tax=Fomitiporia mediterranea (strain MF3/22) TaxID=694068 RepID=UPI0004409840|nr:protease propeptide/inhibitor [Fomitiporia mediterranea MF3/22]EJD03288.1 protease propeptide/inhibitor [Fomitiporia mediterranea MF3/22]